LDNCSSSSQFAYAISKSRKAKVESWGADICAHAMNIDEGLPKVCQVIQREAMNNHRTNETQKNQRETRAWASRSDGCKRDSWILVDQSLAFRSAR